MAEVLGKSGFVSYREIIEEYEVPIRGFLFKGGTLKGIYVRGGLLPVTEELPKDINEDILRGKARKKLLVREIKYKGAEIIEIYIQDGYITWPVYEASLDETS
ncbi:hypothetical protein TON_0215 [Thermococcus onnurineus NA1]|uniref:Uncharacterized protein n=1 Tax=Thermococcus onnurineus (strain NA1) TaxID=523850 RepID=B6YT13_THEON|nr:MULTISPECIES: hypothetical protein [Thermococcus]ACJ15700.1 hypothetical protein TON_0215 [Thermococcus onnurineus NA1]NJE42571.1 hypothetical protein [Thermococcus sp. GR6]NJE46960.1 hypothetical protein [Thermococcus sp. GR7]NJE78988.1 hypothetical protein [Thermococcus sp. GR4]NJF22668.1 hypothetical protein [Thermococcus sp. GR5]